jgi:hypothetical protein
MASTLKDQTTLAEKIVQLFRTYAGIAALGIGIGISGYGCVSECQILATI